MSRLPCELQFTNKQFCHLCINLCIRTCRELSAALGGELNYRQMCRELDELRGQSKLLKTAAADNALMTAPEPLQAGNGASDESEKVRTLAGAAVPPAPPLLPLVAAPATTAAADPESRSQLARVARVAAGDQKGAGQHKSGAAAASAAAASRQPSSHNTAARGDIAKVTAGGARVTLADTGVTSTAITAAAAALVPRLRNAWTDEAAWADPARFAKVSAWQHRSSPSAYVLVLLDMDIIGMDVLHRIWT